jgi:hypothetical protein
MSATKTEAVKMLVDLAQEMEIKDNIDWGMLNIREVDAYELMANSVIDQFLGVNDKHKDTVMMATIVKLLVENFVLNLRLQGQG